ncbi:MAG: cell division protein ZapA [Burkholderiales bacterium]|nr:cell division protein ZapA [Burkholderiales bacterium]
MSAKKKKTLDVMIMGRTYKVACEEDEREELLEAVELLDGRMLDIKTSGKVLSAERVAIMAALNIAHELLALKRQPASGVDSETLVRRMRNMHATLDEVLSPQDKLL